MRCRFGLITSWTPHQDAMLLERTCALQLCNAHNAIRRDKTLYVLLKNLQYYPTLTLTLTLPLSHFLFSFFQSARNQLKFIEIISLRSPLWNPCAPSFSSLWFFKTRCHTPTCFPGRKLAGRDCWLCEKLRVDVLVYFISSMCFLGMTRGFRILDLGSFGTF